MHRFPIPLILLSVLTFNTQASGFLAQEISTGTDGLFNLTVDSSLFTSPGSIYNFTDFTLATGATLNITESGPVYIYSQQNITIDGAIISNNTDLHLIAQNVQINGTINTRNNLSLFTSGNSATPPDTLNSIIISSTPGVSLTTGTLSNTISSGSGNTSIISGENTLVIGTPGVSGDPVIINPAPVPLPAALWLMISGLLGLGLIKRRSRSITIFTD